MMRWLRRCPGPSLAPLLLAGMLAGIAGANHGGPADDVDCLRLPESHDPAAHRFTDGTGAAAGDRHCAICHWIHSLRPLVRGRIQAGGDHQALGSVQPFVDLTFCSAVAAHLPARSPPFV